MTLEIDEGSWESDYKSDPAICAKYYTANGDLRDPKLWHNGRLWKDDRIIVPATKVPAVLDQFHDHMVSGHWGIPRTADMLRRRFVIPHLKEVVTAHVKGCRACMLNKAQRHRQKGLLEPLYLPTRKWQSVSMDWIVKLPPVKAGGAEYDSCLIFTDRATKMVHLAPSNVKETAPQTAQLFMRYVVKYHGLPRSLQCDRDSKVTSAFWQELCNILDIRVRTTSSFHPQANGQAERTNQTVKQLPRIAASQ